MRKPERRAPVVLPRTAGKRWAPARSCGCPNRVPAPTTSSAFRHARCLVIRARVRPYLSILAEVRNWKGRPSIGRRADDRSPLPSANFRSAFRQVDLSPPNLVPRLCRVRRCGFRYPNKDRFARRGTILWVFPSVGVVGLFRVVGTSRDRWVP